MKKASKTNRSANRSKSSKVKRKKAAVKNKSKAKGDDGINSDYNEEDLDLDKEMHPIGYYINDKRIMVENMFQMIHTKKLRSMLTPILSNCSVDELKGLCIDQLHCMSKKRIRHILSGEEMNSSSDTDDSENLIKVCSGEISKSDEKAAADSTSMDADNTPSSLPKQVNQDSAVSHSGDFQGVVGQVVRPVAEDLKICPDVEEMLTLLPNQESDRVVDSAVSCDTTNEDSKTATEQEQKTVEDCLVPAVRQRCGGNRDLEILELELRAKAIRALMKGMKENDDYDDDATEPKQLSQQNID